MTKQVQRRRGTATQHTSFTGAEGEISVNTTNKSVHVHDGVTAGGVEAARADLGNVSDASLNTALAGNTLSSLTITSADINGGTIDGTVIGGTTPAAVTGTTLTATTIVANGGIYLGGTGAANLLDDYEEGSFTPVVADAASGGNEAPSYTRNYGYYTKIGRQVTILIELTNIDTTGLTGSNDMYITGLPFAAASVAGAVRWVGSMQFNFITLGALVPYLSPTMYETFTSLRIVENGDNSSGDTLTVSQLTSGTADFNITLTYFTE